MPKILITGVAGFIGSHLLHKALAEGYDVIGLDNFLTGKESNLEEVLCALPEKRQNFKLFRADMRDFDSVHEACQGVDLVLHQAALGSVPWSIDDPKLCHDCNVTAFIHLIEAARRTGLRRIVYASSSAVYGDSPRLPAKEGYEGRCHSPYAVSKRAQELYAETCAPLYELELIGLRYFNVFGPRQDPNGPYAAVIPRWIEAARQGQALCIFGDGNASRDFCPVSNVVLANWQAATQSFEKTTHGGLNLVANIACGQALKIIDLAKDIQNAVRQVQGHCDSQIAFQKARPGDILHSYADIQRARELLNYQPQCQISLALQSLVQDCLKGPSKQPLPTKHCI